MSHLNQVLTVVSPSGLAMGEVGAISVCRERAESRRRAWQHVQKAQAGLLDAMRALDEVRDQMPSNTYDDCERVLDEAYRMASQAQGHLLIAERNVQRVRSGLVNE